MLDFIWNDRVERLCLCTNRVVEEQGERIKLKDIFVFWSRKKFMLTFDSKYYLMYENMCSSYNDAIASWMMKSENVIFVSLRNSSANKKDYGIASEN